MRNIKTIMIANRGEIALRIARACRLLGLRTVGVYSEADSGLAHLKLVDQALCIGPASAAQSYLDGERILRAAALTDTDAIHPGYGFLSENSEFAAAVERAGLTLIGPSSDVMRLMGDKISARRTMRAVGVPCLSGSDDALPSDMKEAHKLCEIIGYPLIIKAAGGGGGRGMRVAHGPDELENAIVSASKESGLAFGNSSIYAERFLESPRHVEIQILADKHGHTVWLGARDCSVQRRHQKLIEEAPPPGIPINQIEELGFICANAASSIGYSGAGTFEFLYEDGHFHFIEMNTRLQVEHPVTEMTTGIDIVCEQIRVAAGLTLSFSQSDIQTRGCSIECRVNAENPRTFLPSPGKIEKWHCPGGPGVRVESHIYDGYTVPPHYDSLIAKLIVHGKDRKDAIYRMKAALEEAQIEGISTTVPLHLRLMDERDFNKGIFTVHSLDKRFAMGEI